MEADTATGRTSGRNRLGMALAMIGAALVMVGVVPGTAGADTGPIIADVPLGNDEANFQENCPDEPGLYWHFVITPNNGSLAFASIELDLGDATFVFDGDDIVPNGDQLDNVFVRVPDGYTLTSLVKEGSSADIELVEGDAPRDPKFVLSHLCSIGSSTTTTTAPTTTVAETTTTGPTTTVAETTTTAPTTTTAAPTTTVAETTTTVAATTTTVAATTTTLPASTTTLAETTTTTLPETTTTLAETTTTTLPETTTTLAGTTTTELVGQGGPTTTLAPTTLAPTTFAPTSTLSGQLAVTTTSIATELPRTGAEQRLLLVGGAALMVLGLLMVQLGRRASAV